MLDIYLIVGQRIRAERKERKLTLEELASLAGMNTSFLHHIETGKKKLSLATLQNVARALRMPISRLLARVDVKRLEDRYADKLSALVRRADSEKRETILRVVRELTRASRSR